MSKIILIILSVTILVVGSYLGITTLLKNQSGNLRPVTITVWGVKDDEGVMKNVIAGFEKRHPNITVNYSTQTLLNYRTRVQTQISSGKAADIVAIHNTWTPMFLAIGSLAPAPSETFAGNYTSSFYKVVSDNFVSNGKIYGIPSEIDGLALFYNLDILKAQNIGLPKTWDDVVNAAVLTTVANDQGVTQTGGLGVGNTENVDNWSEIIGLLFLQQPNAKIENPDNSAGKEVVQFFKNPTGSQKKRIWDKGMPSTTESFANGNLTFYLGPAEMALQIKKKNPQLNFGVMPVPQLPDTSASIACYWGYGVSSTSKNQKEAWQFLKFLTDSETEKYINEQETSTLGMGRPYPRKDLQKDQENDKYLGAFVKQADSYKSWYLCPDTQDNGINDRMIDAYKLGIDDNDLTTLSAKIPGILIKFNNPPTTKK